MSSSRMQALLLSVAACSFPAFAAENAITYYLDPTTTDALDQAARLLITDESGTSWNPGDIKFRTRGIQEIALATEGKPAFVAVNTLRKVIGEGVDAVVVAPGTYLVALSCEGGGFGGAMFPLRRISAPVRVEAGFDYEFACAGRVAARVRVDVHVRPRTAPSIAAQTSPIALRGPESSTAVASDVPWSPRPTTDYVDVPSRTINIPTAETDANVMAAVERGLIGRGWNIEQAHRNWARATLRVREHSLTVDLVRIGGTLQIIYIDSENLDFEVRKGIAKIHRQYFGWTNYLMADIAGTLGLPSPET
jgi:hypothetical protein